MAQTIKIRRGGINTLATTAPSSIGGSGIAAGELILGTGSFNGLAGPLLLAANGANTVSPAYSRIDTIANGPALEAAIGANGDVNLTGLTIHSGSKFYRYSGTDTTGFEELTVSAGSFDGTLGVTSGGTGLSSISDGDVLVSDSNDSLTTVSLNTNGTILVGGATPAAVETSSLGGNGITATGGNGTLVLNVQNLNDTITVAAGGISVNTGSISSGGTNLVNADVINSLSASIATDITSNAGSVSGTANQVAFFDGVSSVTSDTGMTYNSGSDVLTVGNSTFGTNVTVAGNLTVQGTTTTVNSETLNVSSSIVRVNYGGAVAEGGMEVTDATGGNAATGSLLWDGTNDWWKAGAKTSEKRVVTFNDNSGGTDTAIQKLNGDSNLVDSSLTDDGSTVTIANNVDLTLQGTGQLTVPEAVIFSGLTVTDSGDNTDEVLFVQSDGTVGQIDATATTDVMNGILGYTDGGLTFSTVIDGGTF